MGRVERERDLHVSTSIRASPDLNFFRQNYKNHLLLRQLSTQLSTPSTPLTRCYSSTYALLLQPYPLLLGTLGDDDDDDDDSGYSDGSGHGDGILVTGEDTVTKTILVSRQRRSRSRSSGTNNFYS